MPEAELFATEKKAQAAVEAMAFEEEAVDEAAAFEEEVIDDEEVLDDEEAAAEEVPAAPEAPDAARHRVLQRCMAFRLICSGRETIVHEGVGKGSDEQQALQCVGLNALTTTRRDLRNALPWGPIHCSSSCRMRGTAR